MKTKSKTLLTSLLLVIAFVFSIIAVSPMPAYAVSITPDKDTPAETIYVGGVALKMDQYVMNGSSTVVDGAPADDADGFAWYSEAGLLLVNYVYEGQGHLYDGDNYAVISSMGLLVIEFYGTNKLTQTEEYGTGIYAGGDLVIDGYGPTAVCLEVTASFALYTEYSLYIESNAKGIKINSDYRAMTAYDLIVFGGGEVDVTTYYPISLMSTENTAQIVIVNGSVEVKSNSGAFAIPPYLNDYNDTGKEVEFILSENADGSNPLEKGSSIDMANFSKYKYFYFGEKEIKREIIENILVRNIEKPQVGESFNDLTFTPDTLFYGGEYKMVGRGFEKFDGTDWVDYTGSDDLVEAGVMYRLFIVLAPNDGYDFSTEITRNNVQIDYGPGEVDAIFKVGDVHYASIYLNVQYANADNSFGITVAVNDGDEVLGVKINEDNCDDVLGDGTLSYNPETSTLTLNNYVYEGVGYEEDGAAAIFIDVPEDGMTINLVGKNRIIVTSSFGAGFGIFGEGNVTVKGSGSLEIQAGMYGFMAGSNQLVVDGGNILIKTTGTPSAGLAVSNFTMNGGNLKIDSVFIGIITMNSANEIKINGGDLEIGVLSTGNTVAYATDDMVFTAKALDLSGYIGKYEMSASVNKDGSGAVEYNPAEVSTYKFIKILHSHIDSDANGKCDICEYQMSTEPINPDSSNQDSSNPETSEKPDSSNPETSEKIEQPQKGLSGGAIAGIVAGGVVVLGGGGFAIFWFAIKKKRFADLIAVFKKK